MAATLLTVGVAPSVCSQLIKINVCFATGPAEGANLKMGLGMGPEEGLK